MPETATTQDNERKLVLTRPMSDIDWTRLGTTLHQVRITVPVRYGNVEFDLRLNVNGSTMTDMREITGSVVCRPEVEGLPDWLRAGITLTGMVSRQAGRLGELTLAQA